MEKLNNITAIVKTILIEQPQTRDDDNILWLEVLRAAMNEQDPTNEFFGHDRLNDYRFAWLLAHVREYGLPSYGSVSRARRRLQAKYPELRGAERVQRKRAEREKVFVEYGRSGCI